MGDYLNDIKNLERENTILDKNDQDFNKVVPVVEFIDNSVITQTEIESSEQALQDNAPYITTKKVVARKYRLKK